MYLTDHWARQGINSYSKQRAIMGSLVVRKLRISNPARRYTRITEHLYTLFSKHSLGQAWKDRGRRDFNWQVKGRQSEEKAGVCSVRSLDAWVKAPDSKTSSPQRPNHQMTWSKLTMKLCSTPSNTPCVHSFLCILFFCAHTHTQACVSMCMHVCLFPWASSWIQNINTSPNSHGSFA